ncbi:MAG: hypothetical protein AB1898_02085 [Acidobacteriota bacterium]
MGNTVYLFRERNAAGQASRASSRNEPDRAEEFRCGCGSLLAKILPEGIEIKCRKCKRIELIPKARIVERWGDGSGVTVRGAGKAG